MSAFEAMVDAQFEDPHLGLDAVWRPLGGLEGQPVRVRRRSPDAVEGFAGNQIDLEAMLIEVRLSEVSAPAETDQVDLLDEDGAVTETLVVTGLTRIDMRRLVRTCEVETLAAEDEDDEA